MAFKVQAPLFSSDFALSFFSKHHLSGLGLGPGPGPPFIFKTNNLEFKLCVRCKYNDGDDDDDSAKIIPLKDLNALPSKMNRALPLNMLYGLPGAYSEDAALKAYPQCETVPCEEVEDALKAVELCSADKAVIPIENSSAEAYTLPVNFSLLALPGVTEEQLKRVLSHPQALSQSDNFLTRLGVIRENIDDTAAAAAQMVASNHLRDARVVASVRATEIYGLNVLAQGIQDNQDSITRFLILARDPIIPKIDKTFKTSIVFTLEEGPGVLFNALAAFALRDINLTKIESRPQRKRPLRVVDDYDNGSAKSLQPFNVFLDAAPWIVCNVYNKSDVVVYAFPMVKYVVL